MIDKSETGSDPKRRRIRSFMRWIRERFFHRLHMSLILMATALTGLLATKVLLMLQVENIVIRYPLAVICAYLAFFLFVKLWLAYITASEGFRGSDLVSDVLPDLSGAVPGGNTDIPGFSGGGGGSGGGGASASFDGGGAPARSVLSSGSSGGSGIGEAAGDAVSGIFDSDEGIMVLIVLGVLLAVIFGAGIYLIYIAPHILSEAAFDFLLGSSLLRSYRKVTSPD